MLANLALSATAPHQMLVSESLSVCHRVTCDHFCFEWARTRFDFDLLVNFRSNGRLDDYARRVLAFFFSRIEAHANESAWHWMNLKRLLTKAREFEPLCRPVGCKNDPDASFELLFRPFEKNLTIRTRHAAACIRGMQKQTPCWTSQDQDKTAKAALAPEIRREGGFRYAAKLQVAAKAARVCEARRITLAESERNSETQRDAGDGPAARPSVLRT